MLKVTLWPTLLAAAFLLALPSVVSAQQTPLTLDDIFTSPRMTGSSPSGAAWAPNSEHFAFSWTEPGQRGRGLWVASNDGQDVRHFSQVESPSVRSYTWTDADTIVRLRGHTLWQTSLDSGDAASFMSIEGGAYGR
ncbi:MAG: hypothetical protein OXQ30_01580, partial [Boseongicola sp.]|nr:hypothetical protein [Boseongicola sp.]